jgi:DNA repair exonuclease SbcCD ATPase subunit
MKVKLGLLVFGLAVVMMLGCAKAPQQAVDAAKAALEAAKTAEVDRYFADQYNAAYDSLSAALTEIETQNSKSAISRNYSKASALLASVTDTLNELMPQVEAKKEEVKVTVDTLQAKVQDELAATKKLIAIAPRGKEGSAALAAIQSELSTCETSLSEVNAVVEKGDWATAQDQLNATLAKIASLKNEIQQAIDKKAAAK